ncbi:ABC transporter substrate-binding protein [Streptomyces sp. NPDC094038]|uniref:ABC transporter substrate-binding protein n=1 Tax=Streptomyces sp. NPDC094038 TaxID=3366055 RepID=UPI0037FD357A
MSKPLGDVRVRQAINYAIDRDAVTKALLGSSGTPTVQTVVKGGDGYYVRPGTGGVEVSAGAPFAGPLAFHATK